MGRLEFRFFAQRLPALRQRLLGLYTIRAQEQRTDIYLQHRSCRQSFKLRGGQNLELKLQLGQAGGSERWHPIGSVPLPARGADLTGTFCDADEFPVLEAHQVYASEDMIAAFRGIGHAAITTHKLRVHLSAPGAEIEIAHVNGAPGGPAETLCIEAELAAPIESLRQVLGLELHRCESYPRWLLRQLAAAAEEPVRSL